MANRRKNKRKSRRKSRKKSRRKSRRKSRKKSRRKSKRKSRRKSRRKNKIVIKGKHDLKQFGYSGKASSEVRKKAVQKAAREYGSLPVIRKLNALYVLNKNRNPTFAKKAKSDQKWLSNKRKNK